MSKCEAFFCVQQMLTLELLQYFCYFWFFQFSLFLNKPDVCLLVCLFCHPEVITFLSLSNLAKGDLHCLVFSALMAFWVWTCIYGPKNLNLADIGLVSSFHVQRKQF